MKSLSCGSLLKNYFSFVDFVCEDFLVRISFNFNIAKHFFQLSSRCVTFRNIFHEKYATDSKDIKFWIYKVFTNSSMNSLHNGHNHGQKMADFFQKSMKNFQISSAENPLLPEPMLFLLDLGSDKSRSWHNFNHLKSLEV